MNVETITVGCLSTNCYLCVCDHTSEAIVIDPGADAERILNQIRRRKVTVTTIVLTHAHFDHLLAAQAVQQATEAELAIHRLEAEQLENPSNLFPGVQPDPPKGLQADRKLEHGDILQVGQMRGRILHTPGHSPGGISLSFPQNRCVFCGDVLFRRSVGRTDLPGGDAQTLLDSITQLLLGMPDDTIVYPGHGPKTSIGYERRNNPWLRRR